MNKFQRRLRKTGYYGSNLLRLLVPRGLHRRRLAEKLDRIDLAKDQALRTRFDYCFQVDRRFELPADAPSFRDIPLGKKNTFYIDYFHIWKHFDSRLRSSHLFGDILFVPEIPTFVKCRPVVPDNANSLLLKWNQIRLFYYVDGDMPYHDKQDRLIWRGRAGPDGHRRQAIEPWYDRDFADIGDCDPRSRELPWYKPFTSIPEQLKYKFILSLEGGDIASNLKWIMSSNSLCFMRKARYESWYMEGRLIPDFHYVSLRDDYLDLEEKVDYYRRHPREAESIIANAHAWVEQFRDFEREESLQLHMLLRFLELTGQVSPAASRYPVTATVQAASQAPAATPIETDDQAGSA